MFSAPRSSSVTSDLSSLSWGPIFPLRSCPWPRGLGRATRGRSCRFCATRPSRIMWWQWFTSTTLSCWRWRRVQSDTCSSCCTAWGCPWFPGIWSFLCLERWVVSCHNFYPPVSGCAWVWLSYFLVPSLFVPFSLPCCWQVIAPVFYSLFIYLSQPRY